MTKYKLLDTQNVGTFRNVIFDSRDQVRKQLISYHSIDWTGEKDIESLSLYDLLDYGEWELQEIEKDFVKCPLCCADSMSYKSWLGTHLYICDECPFLSMEYYNDNDITNLQDYLKFN